MRRAVIHSYGGGVQSAAVAVLVVQGKLPRPERVVMADTGREAALTWKYLAECVQPLLATTGLRVEIASHSLATVDMYPKAGGRPLIPAFTAEKQRLPSFCSVEWKRRVVHRWLRAEGYGPARPVTQWLGISVDETARARTFPVSWAMVAYPLLDMGLTRTACIQLVERAGLPRPPRSSCWMCPFRLDAEWMAMRERNDGDWDKALEMDASIRDTGNGGLYLHRSAKPLAAVEFRHEHQRDLFDVCEEGRCEF